MGYLQHHTRIAVHFHPDRLTPNGKDVVTGMLETGRYLSQYETGISNGSPTAFAGGERDEWERHLFGGFYHNGIATLSDRPKYGSLQIFPYPDGPSPRFGSCYLLLKKAALLRSSFTYAGSQEADAQKKSGTIDHFQPVLAALLQTVEKSGSLLGKSNLDIPMFLKRLARLQAVKPGHFGQLPLGRELDSFIEVQIHGEIVFSRDVEMLVCDPSYGYSVIGKQLTAISKAYGFPIYWHSGFKMPVAETPGSFRGYEIRSLAERITPGAIIDPAILGAGANSFFLKPGSWADWGNEADLITRFRRLWHAMVVYKSLQEFQ